MQKRPVPGSADKAEVFLHDVLVDSVLWAAGISGPDVIP